MLDDTDRRLLRHLLADPAQSSATLAERVGIAPATAWRRVERLTEQGIIRAQEAVIDWRALGYGVEVSLRFTLDKTVSRAFEDFTEAARRVPEVLAIETFLGRVDLRLNVIARDMTHWQEIYRTRILTLPHITDIEALMLISTLKDAEALPV
ncbi:Lrp/AsnC family transcriptional regulator [Falsirhodobacter sp. 1013]|uniref:Lrp/AsnC family transcriptional regulator n=1 Tax=Falsirhodobacter sp. 1013 TaxID=3417566 RepID=UPI003EBC99DD